MEKLINLNETNFDDLPIDGFWNLGNTREKKMHRIHAYPAKFPAFITEKALEFAKNQGLHVSKIADVFCGCGTVAFEAKRSNIDFWGCDINPVATLIAKVKSRKYSSRWLKKYYSIILANFESIECESQYQKANPRLQYWYDKEHYNELFKLKMAIDKSIPISSEYRLFFICAFSNILKASSKWLTKSIKPQIDPNKTPCNALASFSDQVELMIGANEDSDALTTSKSEIITGNILELNIPSDVDMIVSSPPYVTSYEYADLHQLSSLWLNYTSDYRSFRKGSIGSIYNDFNFQKEVKNVNNSGQKIVFSLYNHDKSKARSVAKYFLDMQKVA
ncbi:MAG: class I SAM-dependent methyltransferase, partial [Ruminiclostridium sp.]|nr:class I SAM-dependent methyltransferase [Ruminiclostridium sp.]